MLKISHTFSLCGLTWFPEAASSWINVSVLGRRYLGGSYRVDQHFQFQVFEDTVPYKISVLYTFCHNDIESGVDQNVQIHVNRLPDSLNVFPS